MSKNFAMKKTPHEGWQESAENWENWYQYRVNNDMAARDALFSFYAVHCTRILSKHVTYSDQRDQSVEDAKQETAILILTIMGEFNPTRAQSFKAYIISYGTKRAVDVARKRSSVPRRAREATAIFNEAREQLIGIEGHVRGSSRADFDFIIDYMLENEMWPAWLGKPTVEKIRDAIITRDRGLSEYSLDTLASSGSADDDGARRDSNIVRVESHETDVVNAIMLEKVRNIIELIMSDIGIDDREVIEANINWITDSQKVGGVEAVQEMLQQRASAGVFHETEITIENAKSSIVDANTAAASSFLRFRDDILVLESGDELIEIISRYFDSVDKFTQSPDGSNYTNVEQTTLC